MFRHLTRQNILVTILTVMVIALTILGGFSAIDILTDKINTSASRYSTLPVNL